MGWLGIVSSDKGLVTLLRGGKNRSQLHRWILRRYPSVHKGKKAFHRARLFLKSYFKGNPIAPPRIDLSSKTPFQQRVLRQTQKIPYGQVRTYEWLARKVRSPGGSRACGTVLHKNPLPLFIPCHRIVLKSGKRGGFAWGKKMKGRFLQSETEK